MPASLIARLHAVPLVYADISPNNIFISETADASEVWLIDLDNLDYLSPNASGIYTPGFGAPEVASGRAGVTTLSDSFSFAVLAFYVLAQAHPFLGDYVEEGGWDDDEDREQLAFHGQVPSIENPDDNSNRTARGIPRHLVLSKPVRELFHRTFGPGRKQRELRPSMVEWADVLRRAADRVVSCKGCGSTFDVTAGTCQFCTASLRPAFIHMQVNRWDARIDDTGASAVSSRPVWHKMLDASKDGVVMRHVVEPVLADSDDPPVLRVRVVPRGISIEPLSSHEIHVVLGARLQQLSRNPPALAHARQRGLPALRGHGPPPSHGGASLLRGWRMRLEQVPHGQIDELRLRWAAATAVLPRRSCPEQRRRSSSRIATRFRF